MLFKIARKLSKGRGEKVNFVCGLEYVLLVHRNLLEGISGHLKILLESVLCDFEEISNKYYFSNIFST
jgi:hypothetical protein